MPPPVADNPNGVYQLVAVPDDHADNALAGFVTNAKILCYRYDQSLSTADFIGGLDDFLQNKANHVGNVSLSVLEIVGDGSPQFCGPLSYCDLDPVVQFIGRGCMENAWIILTGCNTGTSDSSVCIASMLAR